ncbi:hypothetical protein [Fictibacillus arsenicus]|uniref:Uncharacterized protein n=1 Tax=Fictibacillus arsenicus TaxID=255247 RepID=A0A1V3G9W7_9BACL|nr:hypothetical protein [Fictibacillus arsenicus]OOE13659.1 hypothetical protein UN64_00105 [Fictibacillus arsenicus]
MNIIEAIIDILIANIAFVIIIAGGLYSFFKRLNDTKDTNKSAPAKRKNERPKEQASPFGVPRETVSELEREIAISPEKKPGRKEAISKRYEEIKQSSNGSNRYQDKEEAILGSFKADQKELQKAVIWSEILSKPKALQKRM